MKKLFLLIGVLSVCLLCAQELYADGDADIYSSAKLAAKEGNRDFAFMQFHTLLRLSPGSAYYHDSLFAVGEYHFSVANYYDAYKAFEEFVELYPRSEALPYAVVYLLKIESAQEQSNNAELEKKVITFKQLSLLFSEYKEYLYKSPLGVNYKAIYFIDKVEIYINEVLFETVYF